MKKKFEIGSNRSFGIVFFLVFLIIGLFPLKNGEDLNHFLIIISLIFLFLGPEYNQKEIENELNKLGANFRILTEDEIIEKTAKDLENNKAVGFELKFIKKDTNKFHKEALK
ncbi:hypothetical protein OAM12_04975 [Candidatus Pelagibacter sp.]|nr:hypothetical protein [Candidatus Pelagibacter sp.]